MDRLRVSPAQPVPSSFLTSEDLYELLQGRFSSNAALSSTSLSTSVPDTTRPYYPATSEINPAPGATENAPGALKMEPEMGDVMSNLYNWVPTQLYNDSLGCLYSNHLSQPPDINFACKPPDQTPPQIQALRDFMAYGNMSNQIMPSPHLSSVNSRATTPSLFYQLDEGPESLVGAGGCSQLSQSKQDLMAHRAFCTEIYATERSPHRSQFQRENHILAERQRREEMNEKFSALRAMIPKATKKDKASIVGDTINYVLELEKRLKHLQACKDTKKGASFKSLKRKTAPTAYECEDSERHMAADDSLEKPLGVPTSDDSIQQPAQKSKLRDDSAVSSPSEQLTEESKMPGKQLAEVDVQNLGNQAVIKIVCPRNPGQVLRVLHALEECKVDVLQSNVTAVGDKSIHFVTVQLEDGVSVTTEELISAMHQAACPDSQAVTNV